MLRTFALDPPNCRRCSRLAALLALLLTAHASEGQPPGPRTEFLDALGQFSLALEGRYGDEGAGLQASVASMADSLTRWDAAIAGYEESLEGEIHGAAPDFAARVYVALAGEYLDRGRTQEAIDALTSARAVAPTSAAAPFLQALAYSRLLGDPASAVEPMRAAVAARPGDPARLYMLARALTRTGQEDAATAVLRTLVATPIETRTTTSGQGPLFIPLGLVPETAGLEPFLPPVLYADGFAALQRGDLSGAIAQFREALARDPLAARWPASTGEARDRAAAAFRDGRVEEATTLLEAALNAGEASQARRLLGLVQLASGEPALAVSALRSAVRLDPRDERARLDLASALDANGEVEQAIAVLRETLETLPGSGRAHLALGRLQQRQGRYGEAITEFESTLAFGPLLGRNTLYRTIGELRRSSQDFEGAVEALGASIDLAPNAADAHQALGEVHALLGHEQQALGEFHVTLMLGAQSADTYTSIAQVHLRQSRYAQAAEAAVHALQLDSRHRQARYVYATSLIRQGRVDEGMEEMAVFQRLEGEDAALRARAFELGRLRREATVATDRGDHDTAADLLRKALVLDPRSPASHLDLGVALLAAGRAGEAIERLTTAAALGAPFDAYRHLAEAYLAQGRIEESRKARATYSERRRESIRERQGGR